MGTRLTGGEPPKRKRTRGKAQAEPVHRHVCPVRIGLRMSDICGKAFDTLPELAEHKKTH